MFPVTYTVVGESESAEAADRFQAWLVDGHAAEVVRAGAEHAVVIRLDADGGRERVEVRYVFASRRAFQAYEDGPAAELRQEGVQLFGPDSDTPIRFRRTLGEVAAYIDGA